MFIYDAQANLHGPEYAENGTKAHLAYYCLQDLPSEERRRECPDCGYRTMKPIQHEGPDWSRMEKDVPEEVPEWLDRRSVCPEYTNTFLEEGIVWRAHYSCWACGCTETVVLRRHPGRGESFVIGGE